MEKIVSGEMCSRIIICWRKMSGDICLGEHFVGEKCESLHSPWSEDSKNVLRFDLGHREVGQKM